jgi:hypothetical protein
MAGLISGRAGRLPTPAIPALPPMPIELARGRCTSWPDPGLWTSARPADRSAAIRICESCPVLPACQSWAIRLPVADTSVYAAMSSSERTRRKRQQLAEAG